MKWTLDNAVLYTKVKYGLKNPIPKSGGGKFVFNTDLNFSSGLIEAVIDNFIKYDSDFRMVYKTSTYNLDPAKINKKFKRRQLMDELVE